jgi:hypothetical protein
MILIFRKNQLEEAAHRYKYALRRIPRLEVGASCVVDMADFCPGSGSGFDFSTRPDPDRDTM